MLKFLQENRWIFSTALIILVNVIITLVRNRGNKPKKVDYRYRFYEEKPRELDEETESRMFYLDSKQREFIQTFEKLNKTNKTDIRMAMYNISNYKRDA